MLTFHAELSKPQRLEILEKGKTESEFTIKRAEKVDVQSQCSKIRNISNESFPFFLQTAWGGLSQGDTSQKYQNNFIPSHNIILHFYCLRMF